MLFRKVKPTHPSLISDPNLWQWVGKFAEIEVASNVLTYFDALPVACFKCCFKCSNVQTFKCSNIQMFKCSNVRMFKCSNVDLVWRPPDPGLPASNVAAAVYSPSHQSKAARRRFKGKPTLLHVIGRLNCKIKNPPSKTRPDSKVIVFLLLLQCLKRTIWIPVCALL